MVNTLSSRLCYKMNVSVHTENWVLVFLLKLFVRNKAKVCTFHVCPALLREITLIPHFINERGRMNLNSLWGSSRCRTCHWNLRAQESAFPIHGTCLFCWECKWAKYIDVAELSCQATLPWAAGSGASQHASHGFIWTPGLPPRCPQKGVEKNKLIVCASNLAVSADQNKIKALK